MKRYLREFMEAPIIAPALETTRALVAHAELRPTSRGSSRRDRKVAELCGRAGMRDRDARGDTERR
jgi:hypothetical protein